MGVLRGGPSPEYKVSLETGATVLENLDRHIYEPADILISKKGIWCENGFEKSAERIIKKVDVVFNALHGAYGEDGAVQKLLDNYGAPYTGSRAMASCFSMNKIASKKIYKMGGLKTPFAVSIHLKDLSREAIRRAYETVPHPFVVKPAMAGSSVGVGIAHSLPELEEFTLAAFEFSPSVLIEEYIDGKEAAGGVVEAWRGKNFHALLPIEIRPRGNHDFFNYDSKYSVSGGAEEICPGHFSQTEKNEIEAMAIMAHRLLGARHYSRSDFRVHPKRGVFILETNTLPGLTKTSLIPKALSAAGARLSDFLHHVIELALNKK